MKTILVLLIKFYQNSLALFFGGQCRFYPSCSEYAAESFARKGILKGFWVSAKRILKCQPLNSGGYDPVE